MRRYQIRHTKLDGTTPGMPRPRPSVARPALAAHLFLVEIQVPVVHSLFVRKQVFARTPVRRSAAPCWTRGAATPFPLVLARSIATSSRESQLLYIAAL